MCRPSSLCINKTISMIAIMCISVLTPVTASSDNCDIWFFNPTTAHFYRLTSPGTWAEAQAEALLWGGDLVTINDGTENQWLVDTFPGNGAIAEDAYWIGSTDQITEGTFVWISGDSSVYTNWDSGEPNDVGGEDFAQIYTTSNNDSVTPGVWRDVNNSSCCDLLQQRRGIVEVDAFPNNAWVKNDANKHYYRISALGTWFEAEDEAELRGGYLANVANATENQWLIDTLSTAIGGDRLFIGLSDWRVEGTFAWTDGSPVVYSNWGAGEPNNTSDEDFVTFSRSNGLWNDQDPEPNAGIIESDSYPCACAPSFDGALNIDSTLNSPNSVALGDIDGDGDQDVFIAAFSGVHLSWVENTDGIGSFGSPNTITSSASGAQYVVAGDIDGDGDIDAALAAEGASSITWYENTDGAGTFSSGNLVASVASARSVALADIDGDSDLDILCTGSGGGGSSTVEWYENTDGSGSFALGQSINSGILFAYHAVAADIDDDVDMDVVSEVDDSIVWYENTDGIGTFGAAQLISSDVIDPVREFAADIDGDGDVDVLSASQQDGKIAWYSNDGTGSFGPQQALAATGSDGANGVVAADADNDGDIDVFSVHPWGNKVAWYENMDGLGTFAAQEVIDSAFSWSAFVSVGDIDNNGDIDPIAVSNQNDQVVWYASDCANPCASCAEVCLYRTLFELEWVTIATDLGLEDDSANTPGVVIPERWSAAMTGSVLCDPLHPYYGFTQDAYEANLLAFQSESGVVIDAIWSFRHVLAAILLVDQDRQDYFVSLLNLQGSYEVADNIARDGAPEFLSDGGDLDDDGYLNQTEYGNVISTGGDIADFADAAIDPGSSGLIGAPLRSFGLVLALLFVGVIALRWRFRQV